MKAPPEYTNNNQQEKKEDYDMNQKLNLWILKTIENDWEEKFQYICKNQLIEENIRYLVNEDRYVLMVDVGRATNFRNGSMRILFLGAENCYDIEIQNCEYLRNLLKSIGGLLDDGSVDVEGDALYRASFQIILKRVGDYFVLDDLRILADDTDGYWKYLMKKSAGES